MREMKGQIIFGFSVRDDGDMRDGNTVSDFLSLKGLYSKDLVTAQQIHGTTVQDVTQDACGVQISGVDALFYQDNDSSRSVILGIRTADCVPVLLYDQERLLIAAVHSGWRGTLGGITSNVLTEFEKRGSRISNIQCIIGPHIRSCCYSVPEERAALFTMVFGEKSSEKKENQTYLNLTHVVRRQLMDRGVTPEHIHDDGSCTSCLFGKYYSYRKESKESFGEMLGFITVLK